MKRANQHYGIGHGGIVSGKRYRSQHSGVGRGGQPAPWGYRNDYWFFWVVASAGTVAVTVAKIVLG